MKSVLTEAAWASTRTKDTFYSARYHRLAARRGKKRALIAVGHSILKSVYHILADNVSYNELGADYLNARAQKKRLSYLQSEIRKLGFDVAIAPQPSIAS